MHHSNKEKALLGGAGRPLQADYREAQELAAMDAEFSAELQAPANPVPMREKPKKRFR